MNKNLAIIDGFGFLFRSYYGVKQRMVTKSGVPVNGVFGCISMLLKFMEATNPTYIAFAIDKKGRSKRCEIDPEYKANRIEPPEDLIPQFAILNEAIEAMGITRLEQEGYEADDIIAFYKDVANENNVKLTVVSSDKDLAVLMEDNTCDIYDPVKAKIVTKQDVIEKFGIEPNLICEYLSLVGDKVDNIPGVMGIGPKAAAKLLNEFNSLEGIYENLSSLQDSLAFKLDQGRDKAFMSRELVKFITDGIEKPSNIAHLCNHSLNFESFLDFLLKYEMYSIFNRVVRDYTIDEDLVAEVSDKYGMKTAKKKQVEKILEQASLFS